MVDSVRSHAIMSTMEAENARKRINQPTDKGMKMSILNSIFSKAKALAAETHQDRIDALKEKAEFSVSDVELVTLANAAFTSEVKVKKINGLGLTDKALDVLSALSSVKDDAQMSAMLAKWPRHYFDKVESTLETLAGSGRVKLSTAPALILPYIIKCANSDKQTINRSEFVSLIHSYYKAKGKALPATSPNWPNPFASYIGNISDAEKGCQLLVAQKSAGSVNAWTINPSAIKYLRSAR